MSIVPKKSAVYDVAKVVTMLLVVIAHAARMYTRHGVYTPVISSGLMAGLHDFIYAFHMPFFVFVSGCVYGYCIENGKYKDTLAFIKNKAKKLLIPYFVFGIAYVAPAMMFLGLANGTYLVYLIKGIIISLDSRHLWYLMALFWIFLLAIPMNHIPCKGCLKSAATLGISGILFICANFVPGLFQLNNAMSYQFYFFLGVAFNFFYGTFDKISKGLKLCLFLASMLLVATVLFVGSNSVLLHIRRFAGIAMMIVLSQSMLHIFPKIRENALYKLIKRDSFGIYLFHPIIIYWLFSRLHCLNILPMVLVIAVSLAAMIISIYATYLMRKLHLTILIGE